MIQPLFLVKYFNLRFSEHGWTPKALGRVVILATTAVSTFFVVWYPFLIPNPARALDVVHRIFPVARGLFEDKARLEEYLARTFLYCFSTGGEFLVHHELSR